MEPLSINNLSIGTDWPTEVKGRSLVMVVNSLCVHGRLYSVFYYYYFLNLKLPFLQVDDWNLSVYINFSAYRINETSINNECLPLNNG